MGSPPDKNAMRADFPRHLQSAAEFASPKSPLDASTFTETELRAAVEAAENWGTYVTVHAYTPVSIQRAIAAGVTCIEHDHLMDEPTAKQIAERGWPLQWPACSLMQSRQRRAKGGLRSEKV